MAEDRLRKRSEMPEEFTWKLEDIFSSDEAWMDEYRALGEIPGKAVAFEGKLGTDASVLLDFFRLQDEINERLSSLFVYAGCRSDEDTANSFYQDLAGKARGVIVAIEGAASFAGPEIMAIPDDVLEDFYRKEPELETYRRSIYLIRRMKAHMLSPESERVLALAGEAAASPDNIGSVLRNADMKFPDVECADGSSRQMTGDNLPFLLEDPDVDFRRRAFKAYYSRMGELKNTFAATLDAQYKQLMFFQRSRNYATTLEAALDGNEVPTEVYTNLIEAVHRNLDKMYRYVALRKKILGLDELHMYDVYVPIVSEAAQKVTFDEAKETVLKALSVLGDDYTDLLRKGFSERWVDVYPNEGKRGGAYSNGGGKPHPYVLMNYKDNLDSMFTLAHEMGHSLHSWFSTANQPKNTADYVIFVAEVASTCNEILLMRYLLDNTDDRVQRAYLLNHFLDSFKGTLYRQTMLAEFELMMGQMAESGQALTADVLCERYRSLNELYFGPDMISDEEIGLEWARIPHFFYDYYMFQYATGYSAAAAIADRILREGAPAVADYKKFLSSGSSADPISLLRIAGVDMSTPEPVDRALSMFGELVGEFGELMT